MSHEYLSFLNRSSPIFSIKISSLFKFPEKKKLLILTVQHNVNTLP